MKFHTLNRLTWIFALLAVGAFCPNLHAGWGSLQGSNRSASAPAAPRPQPQASRAPQPVERAPEPRQAVKPMAPRSQPQVSRAPQPMERAPEPRQAVNPVAVDRAREQPRVVAQTRADEADRRRMDIDEDRRQSYFWSDFHSGMRINRLPDGYRRFDLRGHAFFYFEGVFYDSEPSGYVIVAPPVDAVVPDLPPGAETVVVDDMVYYYAAGAFYVQQPDGSFVVVPPPMGVTVTMLAPDAVSVVINGMNYYQADGTYYQPVMQDGVTVYLTVPPP